MSCCVPDATGPRHRPQAFEPVVPAAGTVRDCDRVELPGGAFQMGEDSEWTYPGDQEGPVRSVTVPAFALDRCAVTSREFAGFVDATGYLTDAERVGWSFVFAGLLTDSHPNTLAVAAAPWWRQVFGATWQHPEGPGSDITTRWDHPVVHVSCNDARVFARWTGQRLPTEAEWEYAARAGSTTTFPWGDELEPDGRHRANVWQGSFPAENTCDDGWYGTCPVDAFEPNQFGLLNMIGNVWEWTLDPFDRTAPDDPTAHRVLKGGSFLCHASYCRRYRPAARIGSGPDSSSSNVGFRCAG